MITQKYLKSRLRYEPETGHFYWVKPPKYHPQRIGKVAGYIEPGGYVFIRIGGVLYYAHRLAWLYLYGYLPKEIDHKNRIKADNRKSNLRKCTRSQNSHNAKRHKDRQNNLPKCVYPHGERYKTQICINYKSIHIGVFDTPKEAEIAYKNKRNELLGKFA